ncbi:ATPase [Vibrio parahaemolyticus]|uniref:ATPase n=1 Tax=Vibrio parahaemolyticus TaxID=670 RepID=UPI0009930FFA|nr:ATPase [Vibrio parahaemolyticus]OOQ68170.1 ATPase [Vibrio parahaemolyticus]PMT76236.1 ATPase [Vibrio parahaemolyticus]PMT81772.1 ATPase [Vibrio parahaemolyticus]
MARLFDVVRELSGQDAISIQRPYIRLCGDHTQAAVLSQLVFWSGKKAEGQLFYKSCKELGKELEIAPHKVRYAIDQIKNKFPSVISVVRKKAHGAPTNHFKIDADKLVALLFPSEEHSDSNLSNAFEGNDKSVCENSQMEDANLSNGIESIEKTICEDSQSLRFEKVVKPINRSEPYTNKQISNVPSPLETDKPSEPILFEIPLKGKNSVHQVTQSDLFEYRELYPAVDVAQQLRNMIGWSKANPTRQKTAAGIKRFIHSWLCKEQDRGYAVPGNKTQTSTADERVVLKRKIQQIEIDINNENAALIAFQQRKSPSSEEAAKSSMRKIKEMMAQREAWLQELGGLDG